MVTLKRPNYVSHHELLKELNDKFVSPNLVNNNVKNFCKVLIHKSDHYIKYEHGEVVRDHKGNKVVYLFKYFPDNNNNFSITEDRISVIANELYVKTTPEK